MIKEPKIKVMPFEPVLAYTRFKDGRIVHPAFNSPRYKKHWDGEKYTIKMRRGMVVIPKKKK